MVNVDEETLKRDWRLWADWCTATGVDPVRGTPDDLHEFLRFVTGKPRTQERRARNVVRMMRRRGGGDQFLTDDAAPKPGDVPFKVALAQIPSVRYPVGLRGRRDAWLLTVVDGMKFSQVTAVGMTPADVTVYPRLSVRNVPVPVGADPGSCMACAVTRWLNVLGDAHLGWRQSVRDALDPWVIGDGHDCMKGVTGHWQSATTLTPSIDKHGWLAGPLSTVSTSIILSVRRRPVDEVVQEFRRKQWTGDPIDPQELADDFDDVDKRIQELLDRSSDLLDEAGYLQGHTDDLLG